MEYCAKCESRVIILFVIAELDGQISFANSVFNCKEVL